jgi:hypothetical protein
MSDETVLPYNGTEGFISGSDTSRERAERNVKDGTVTKRQRDVLDALHQRPDGMTWKDLNLLLGLHHGQVSGTLSVLHKAGKIVALKTKRDGCHPYLAMRFIDNYHPSQTIMTPSKTFSGIKRAALEKVVEAARAVDKEHTLETEAYLRQAIWDLDAILNT